MILSNEHTSGPSDAHQEATHICRERSGCEVAEQFCGVWIAIVTSYPCGANNQRKNKIVFYVIILNIFNDFLESHSLD